MRLSPGAPDLVASVDGAYVACAGETLTLYSQSTRARVASTPLDGPADVAFLGSDRLLAVVPGNGRTQLNGYALPSLELLATLELDDRLGVITAVGTRALVATESLEQPRVVAVTSKILVETIALREPLLLATAAPEDRLLAASRTRDAQLECWDPYLRRALFRLNLPLLPRAQLAGFAARRRLLWVAAAGPTGTLEVFRFSDGRLQARVDLGALIAGAAGHPDSPRLVVATRKTADAPIELTELDFQIGDRRLLKAPLAPRAMCVVEGAQPALVVVDDDGAPTWVPLAAATSADVPASATSATTTTTAAASASGGARERHSRVSDPADWRGKLHAAKPAQSAAAPAARPAAATARDASGTSARDATGTSARATSDVAAIDEADGERAAHWRDELCDWADRQLAAPRRALETPTFPEESPLAVAIARLALDDVAARALAFVYGARLNGHRDVPVATLARVLSGDDAAWDEALGHGLCAQLGLVRARDGRVAVHAPAARFLDGLAPRVPILGGLATDAELPAGNVRLDGGVEPHAAIGERLASHYGYDVALVVVEGAAPARMLASKLVEARLHGAWPVVDVIVKAARWAHALDDGPTVVIVRGDEFPARIAALPAIA